MQNRAESGIANLIMEKNEEILFGSQDDALFHQVYDTFQVRNAAVATATENAEDSFGSESQDRAFYEACEAYEQSLQATAGHTAGHTAGRTSTGLMCSCHNHDNVDRTIVTGSNKITTNCNPEETSPDRSTSSTTGDGTPSSDQKTRCKQLLLGNTYLTVSNLVAQLWCEQQMIYNFWKPDLEAMGIEATPAVASVMAAASTGNKMHIKRDREVNTYVPVVSRTREDDYAIRFINVIHSLRGLLLHSQPCIREISIFGMPLGQGILVVGTVDELRFDSQDRLELVEFKTRKDILKPIGGAQMQAYKMQMMIYKHMLDDLAQGRVDGQAVLDQLNLDSNRTLSDELLKIIRKLCNGEVITTLGQLMAEVLQQFQFLPFVQVLTLEFSSRDDDKSITRKTVDFDCNWLWPRLLHCLAYWKEEREAEGVDIEDTWKCRICAFSEMCAWRLRMNDIYVQKNSLGKTQGDTMQGK